MKVRAMAIHFPFPVFFIFNPSVKKSERLKEIPKNEVMMAKKEKKRLIEPIQEDCKKVARGSVAGTPLVQASVRVGRGTDPKTRACQIK